MQYAARADPGEGAWGPMTPSLGTEQARNAEVYHMHTQSYKAYLAKLEASAIGIFLLEVVN